MISQNDTHSDKHPENISYYSHSDHVGMPLQKHIIHNPVCQMIL